MSSLNELKAQAAAFRDERDWKQFHNFKDMLLSLSLEVSEFGELFQWKPDKEVHEELQGEKKQIFGEEMADILYWLLLFAQDLDIDLEKAFSEKMAKNAQKYPVEKARGNKAKYSALP